MNLLTIFLTILLLGGGLLAFIYVFDYARREPLPETTIETEIIPYNNLLSLVNVSNENFGTEINSIATPTGINLIKISDNGGNMITKTKEFFDFLKVSPPATLNRILKEEYLVGVISQNEQKSIFLVLTVSNYGQAFSGMLAWEEKMFTDLSFLNQTSQISMAQASSTIATSTTASTTNFKIPMKPEVFGWKDIIVKNKDTRALISEKNKSQLAYTFLDKNTILIVRDIWAIGEIFNIYTSRSFAR